MPFLCSQQQCLNYFGGGSRASFQGTEAYMPPTSFCFLLLPLQNFYFTFYNEQLILIHVYSEASLSVFSEVFFQASVHSTAALALRWDLNALGLYKSSPHLGKWWSVAFSNVIKIFPPCFPKALGDMEGCHDACYFCISSDVL